MNNFMQEMIIGVVVVFLPVLMFALKRKTNFLHGIGIVLLGIYLGMVWDVTGLPDIFSIHWEIPGGISAIPFKEFNAFGCIANVIMVIPLGFFLPLLWKKYRSFSKMVAAGCFMSIFIECLQLFTYRATDIDDLLMNTLGGGIGYGCYWVITRFFPNWKNMWGTSMQNNYEKEECRLVFLLVIACRLFVYPVVSQWIIMNK